MIIDGCYCHARARLIDKLPSRWRLSRSLSLLQPFPSPPKKNISLLSKRNSLPISSLARDLPSLAATTGRAAVQPIED